MNIFYAIKKNIPNTITCLNLLCGSIACIMALRFDEQVWWGIDAYQAAFIMIALAALFDFFDGLVARLLHVVSAIGKELDSLCDCVSFGLAPGLLVYAAMNHADPDSCLCYAALLIPVLGAVRLANFNVDTRQTTSFIGMPIPANAIFWIGFISWYANNTFLNPWFVVALIVVMSLLMVSS
ncbi:MAG: CDP-diacylglycerol--serine O-phosphatidyltransferase, partial [Muribaculaceae bacterium]